MSQSRNVELLREKYQISQETINNFISQLKDFNLAQLERLDDAITFEIWDRDPNHVKKD